LINKALDERSLLPANFVMMQLNIIRSGSDNHKKAKKTMKILKEYGFEEIMLGTNVLTVKHPKYKDIVYKIAMDDLGQLDGLRDMWYSQLIHSYVNVYYVAPQGVYSIQQKLKNFKDVEHFHEYIEEVMHIQDSLVEEYDMLLVDMSLKNIYNYGLDENNLIKILDGSDMVQLEGRRIYCDKKILKKKATKKDRPKKIKDGDIKICNGSLEYDENYHMLICTKCGKEYLPISIERKLRKEGNYRKMRLSHGVSEEVLKELKHDVSQKEPLNIFHEEVEMEDTLEEVQEEPTLHFLPQDPIDINTLMDEEEDETQGEYDDSYEDEDDSENHEEEYDDNPEEDFDDSENLNIYLTKDHDNDFAMLSLTHAVDLGTSIKDVYFGTNEDDKPCIIVDDGEWEGDGTDFLNELVAHLVQNISIINVLRTEDDEILEYEELVVEETTTED